MKKKAVTLTEVLIALSIGLAIFIPTTALFSNSTKQLEKTSNLSFAAGLARYILQAMMTMKFDDIKSTNELKSGDDSGISFCDNSSYNIYFNTLFNLNEKIGDLDTGYVSIGPESCPNLYGRLAKYDYRYIIQTGIAPFGDEDDGDTIKTVNVAITWKEFGENKRYNLYAIVINK